MLKVDIRAELVINVSSLSYSLLQSDFDTTLRLCRLLHAKVAQPLRELPEPQKKDHRLVAVRAKYKMTNVG
jgi:hypothetical protein